MSLALAVVLWFVIAGEKTSERGLAVPVELQNVPTNLELTGDAVNTVEVRLRASPGIIHALGPGEISAQIDLAGSGEGERIIHLTPESIRVPFGVQVVKITPSILTLNFERTLQKVVPVRPRLLGRPAPGTRCRGHERSRRGAHLGAQEPGAGGGERLHRAGLGGRGRRRRHRGGEHRPRRPDAAPPGQPRVKVTARLAEIKARRTFEGLAVAVRGGVGPAPAGHGAGDPGRAATSPRPARSPPTSRPYVTVDPGAPGATQSAKVALDAASRLPGDSPSSSSSPRS